MPYTSLVTGSGGFIGAHVAAALAEAGHRVLGLDDHSARLARPVPEGVTAYGGSTFDANLVDLLFDHFTIEYVFHLATPAVGDDAASLTSVYDAANNAVRGTTNLLSAARRTGRVRGFVFASSLAVLGDAATDWSEDADPRPTSPYGAAKLAAERRLLQAHAAGDVPAVVFRLHDVYGEGQDLSAPAPNTIASFVRDVMAGQAVRIEGDARAERAFTHVRDVVAAMTRVPNTEAAFGEVVNVGADEAHALVAAARLVMARLTDAPFALDLYDEAPGGASRVPPHDKLRRLLPDLPTPLGLDDGLAQMMDALGLTCAAVEPPAEPGSTDAPAGSLLPPTDSRDGEADDEASRYRPATLFAPIPAFPEGPPPPDDSAPAAQAAAQGDDDGDAAPTEPDAPNDAETATRETDEGETDIGETESTETESTETESTETVVDDAAVMVEAALDDESASDGAPHDPDNLFPETPAPTLVDYPLDVDGLTDAAPTDDRAGEASTDDATDDDATDDGATGAASPDRDAAADDGGSLFSFGS